MAQKFAYFPHFTSVYQKMIHIANYENFLMFTLLSAAFVCVGTLVRHTKANAVIIGALTKKFFNFCLTFGLKIIQESSSFKISSYKSKWHAVHLLNQLKKAGEMTIKAVTL